MSQYLVTGGAGFIGSHIVHALLARGDSVRVLDDLSSGRAENLDLPANRGRIELIHGDLRDRDALARALTGTRGVFHQAAMVSVPQSVREPERCYDANVTGTLRLLEVARAKGVNRVVFAASSAAYGDTPSLPKIETFAPSPLSPYASSKVAGEHLLAAWGKCFGMHTVALRYFNVFGPRQLDDSPYTGVFALFARALFEGRAPTIYGDGEQTRDFTYVDCVVRANLLAMDADVETGQVFNVGTGKAISINQLFAAMAKWCGSDLRPKYGSAREGDVRHSLASIAKAQEELNYSPPVEWEQGLSLTMSWYRARFLAGKEIPAAQR